MENPILKEYAEKYTPEELTADGIPTIETQLKEMKKADESIKEVSYKREMTQRVKCLSLDMMGKDFMTNTNSLSYKERTRLQQIMHTYNDKPHDDIIKEFNELVSDKMFNITVDMSKLPMYQV